MLQYTSILYLCVCVDYAFLNNNSLTQPDSHNNISRTTERKSF